MWLAVCRKMAPGEIEIDKDKHRKQRRRENKVRLKHTERDKHQDGE